MINRHHKQATFIFAMEGLHGQGRNRGASTGLGFQSLRRGMMIMVAAEVERRHPSFAPDNKREVENGAV